MILTYENIILFGSILLFVSIIAGKAGTRIGIPVLLLFLIIGMVFGSDGLGISFSNPRQAQFIGNIALVIILFSGGMDTKFGEIQRIMRVGMILSTVGVFLTALLTGTFIWLLFRGAGHDEGFGFKQSILLAAIMSSTDSASVFGLLRSKGIDIQSRVKSILEFESGSNDPMAYMMTITLISLITTPGDSGLGSILVDILLQFSIGGIVGFLIGFGVVWIVNTINLNNSSLYSVLLLSLAFFTFAFINLIKGNGFLGVYVAALVIGNHKIVHRRTTTSFIDATAWLFQIIMFLTLGLLVNPHELLKVASVALLTGIFLIIVARPLVVFFCTALSGKINFRGKLFVSWVGLRGAVPIIFATYPLTAGIPQAQTMFNVVFFITLLSLIVQGSTIPLFAHILKQESAPEIKSAFNIEFPDEIKDIITEIDIDESVLQHGNMLMLLPLPEKTLAVLVKRKDRFFVPKGKTILKPGDKLLLISDNEKELRQMYRHLGIEWSEKE